MRPRTTAVSYLGKRVWLKLALGTLRPRIAAVSYLGKKFWLR